MSNAVVGFFVSLNSNLDEEVSIPKLHVTEGENVFGRDSIVLKDKRLSRRHISLTASSNGSAELLVEGTNPVVVTSGDVRKKLYSREKVKIRHGDVIELIPGHHYFKYVALGGDGDPNEKGSAERNDSRKRLRQIADDEALARRLQDEAELEGCNHEQERSFTMGRQRDSKSMEDNTVEAIRSFRVPREKLPLTFRLMKVQGLPAWANASSVSIGDVIEGDVQVAVLSNYMVDIDWLVSACPKLLKIPHVLVIHGESDGAFDNMKRKKPANWIFHKPPLPISFGTHHSKAMLLIYPRGVRVVVHTANLIHVDWNNKSQGLWMQDFPWKEKNDPPKRSLFQNDLVDYLSALKWPEFTANLQATGNTKINPSFFNMFDYESAAVRLIGSVPGYHTGANMKKWGHMKLRTVLQECKFPKKFQKSPLVYQFSSLGSLDEKWMTELASSMSSGVSEDQVPLGIGEPQIVWPSVEDVRTSIEGYAAGNAIPSPLKNVEKPFLKKYWAKWKASHTGHNHAMPHIKTFARYKGQELAWFLLTSANLSKAAWGALQKSNSQLMIRSYELGVLFLPSRINSQSHGSAFSCTAVGTSSKESPRSVEATGPVSTKLVTLSWPGVENEDPSSEEVIRLPVPYELPPQPYSPEDVPWSWERRYAKKDVLGQVWPRQVQLYVSPDS
uniref:FHA domain-containing protein n=1 Tax=Kalanchoe fedtschenkoi TaxID=63787 RepID=A0A7N0UE80_KALFE